MDTRKVTELKPHPENVRLYGDKIDADFVAQMQERGFDRHHPLIITRDNVIVSGHRRWQAAKQLGFETVPVQVFESDDELEILLELIISNDTREKTNEMIGREFKLRKEIYHELKNRQGERTDLEDDSEQATSVSYETEVKPPSIQAAQSLNVSPKKAYRAEAIVNAIDDLESKGRNREAQQLRTTLNKKSVGAAHKEAQQSGIIPAPARRQPKPESATTEPDKPLFSGYTLGDWKQLSEAEQHEAMQAESATTKFNWQEGNSIEWALWSWNPVTGCKHPCPYCYARDIANRFYPQKFEPSIIPERLSAPFNTQLPRDAENDIGYKNVFTCSMADLFGKWVPSEWIEAVLETCANAPQWNFLFLTKFPIRMSEFDFPDNAWVGTTVDCQIRVKPAEEAFRKINAKVKWLSVEPLLEPLEFESLDMFDWMVLGGSSASSTTPEWFPPWQWINRLEIQAYDAGVMVYEKTNLRDRGLRIREYPTQDKPIKGLPEQLKYLASIG